LTHADDYFILTLRKKDKQMENISVAANIIKSLLSVSFRQVLLISTFVAGLSLAILLLPEVVFQFFRIDNLRTNNIELIGSVAFLATFVVVLSSLYKVVDLVLSKLRDSVKTKQAWRELDNLFAILGRNELLYLNLYPKHQTTLIEFDEDDPIVASLHAKGLIHPTGYVRIGDVVRYRRHYGRGEVFQISSSVYDYLVQDSELSSKVFANATTLQE
jgi:hypothetical protein